MEWHSVGPPTAADGGGFTKPLHPIKRETAFTFIHTQKRLAYPSDFTQLLNRETMILTNTETVPGQQIVAHFGLVSGNTVRAKHVGRDIAASFKNLVGGELKGYTELLEEARQQSVDRMTQQAEALGANAIVNVRFSTSAVTQGAAELYVYGTAVQLG